MKVERRTDEEFESTLTGNVHQMGFDESAAIHLMNVLTDLYEDPELAIIREYSTNAWDAHVEAGNTDTPIKVQLPGPLSPQLVIEDFGIGMDEEDIANTYSKYGASTKRNTNSQSGMLGLGCKSALTYTNQFTVVGTKDGNRIAVSISRSAEGGGSMTVVSQQKTDDPNGVKIIIPVKSNSYVSEKAQKFYSMWPKGTVEIDGLLNAGPRETYKGQTVWLTDNLFVSKELDNSYVVMGNVSYPTTDLLRGYSHTNNGFAYGVHAVAFVEMGEVNFTPAREALMDTPRTKETLTKLKKVLANRQLFLDGTKEFVDSADDKWEALERAKTIKRDIYYNVNVRDYTYKGTEFPPKLEIPAGCGTGHRYHDTKIEHSFVAKHVPGSYAAQNTALDIVLDYAGPDRLYFFHPDPVEKITPYTSRKVRAAQSEGLLPSGSYFAFFTEDARNDPEVIEHLDWVKKENVLDWQTVLDYKLPTNSTRRPSNKPKGAFISTFGHNVILDELDPEVVLVKNTYSADEVPRKLPIAVKEKVDAYFEAKNQEYELITVPSNRLAKFDRDCPGALDAKKVFREIIEDWKANVPEEEINLLKMEEHDYYSSLLHLKGTKVLDPALANMIELAAKVEDRDEYATSPLTYMPFWNYETDDFESSDCTRKFKEIEDTTSLYPLLGSVEFKQYYYGLGRDIVDVDNKQTAKHLAFYINQLYMKRRKK